LSELQRTLSELETAIEELRVQNSQLESTRDEREHDRERWEALFELAPLPYLLTDERGIIRDVNETASSLLAISRRFLLGRPLMHFVDGRRAEFLDALARATSVREAVTIDFTLRPRERAPQPARGMLRRFTLPDNTAGLWWILDARPRIAAASTESERLSQAPSYVGIHLRTDRDSSE
jgi:PAS domain-containing protein